MKHKRREYLFSDLKRADGEQFSLAADLIELPETHNYWLVSYRATHDAWGTMNFTLTIPKSIAATAALAEAIVKGGGEQQVRALLQQATERGRPLETVFSQDGWVLV